MVLVSQTTTSTAFTIAKTFICFSMLAFLYHSYLTFDAPDACKRSDSVQLCLLNAAKRADRWLRATSLFEQAWLSKSTAPDSLPLSGF